MHGITNSIIVGWLIDKQHDAHFEQIVAFFINTLLI